MSQQPLSEEQAVHGEADTAIWTPRLRQRFLLAAIALLCLLLLVVVPPYIGISRYQRRVAAAISGAIGRPVHFDTITLHILPLPGLTIQNFVVSELPEFGAEPVLRANTVEARLRIASLWRRRIEVSRISLDAPSINLVHRREDGRWNLQGILTQASQIESAPTAQPRAGDAPRFPYVEATDARINLKNGLDKLPFSIKETEFALWLPEPGQWHVRLTGRPVRTDTDVNDVGLLRVEGTLARAADLSNAAIDLSASWKPTPMGEAGKLTLGRDSGWRGEASAQAVLHGTLGKARMSADLHLLGLRRSDFASGATAEVSAHCEAETAGLLRSLHDVRCAIPTMSDTSFLGVIDSLRKLPDPSAEAAPASASVKPGVLLLRGEVPNVLDRHSISGTASLEDASASYALAWARVLGLGFPRDLSIGGTFNFAAATAEAGLPSSDWTASWTCHCILPPAKPVGTAKSGEAAGAEAAPGRWNITLRHDPAAGVESDAAVLLAYPESAESGAKSTSAVAASVPMVPASSVVSGKLSRGGYMLLFGSRASGESATHLFPGLAAGMPAEGSGALEAQGAWGTAPIWSGAPVTTPTQVSRRRHKR